MLSCPISHASTSPTLKNQMLELSLSLLKENIEKEDENFIASPFSIYMIADMLANGAKGKTLQGLQEKILDKTGAFSLEEITSALAEIMKTLSPTTDTNNSPKELSDIQKETEINNSSQEDAEIQKAIANTNNLQEKIKIIKKAQSDLVKRIQQTSDPEEKVKLAQDFQNEILAISNQFDTGFSITQKEPENKDLSPAIEINNSI